MQSDEGTVTREDGSVPRHERGGESTAGGEGHAGNEQDGGDVKEVLARVTDGILGLDHDWRITYANERCVTVLSEAVGEQLAAADLTGRVLWDLLPGGRETALYREHVAAVEAGEPRSFEEHYPPLDSWFFVRVYPDEDGVTVYLRDVTRERLQRETLETRQATLREVYSTVADPDLSFDERVDDLLRIGCEVLGTAYGTLSHVSGDDYVFEVVRAPDDTVAEGDTVDLEATYCERVVVDEERLSVADVDRDAPELTERAGCEDWGITCYLGAPVLVDGEPYGTFCFYDTEPRRTAFSDWEVTLVDLMGQWVSAALERKLAEERLVERNERLDQFATVVSHDLRNPISIAEGWLDQARANSEGGTEALDRVADAVDRMDTLVDDVLSLARASSSVDEVGPCDLAAVGADAWATVPTVDATLSTPDDLVVEADESRLRRLLENLFRNAVDHAGPDVDVRVGPTEGGFYVADTGPGIPADDREHVFEFGYSTASDGTGQGLAVVEGVAEAHGWSVSATESAEGGARFEFVDVD